MRLNEACACGASVTIETPDIGQAEKYITAWRAAHLCNVRRDLGERIGFDLFSRKPVTVK